MAATVDAPTHPAPAKTTSAPAAPGWFANPVNRYLTIGGGVVVVALVAWFITLSNSRKETFGFQALDQARNAAEAGNFAQAASDLQNVITTYSGSRAAAEATIVLNQVRLLNGQHELAVVGLQDFIKSNPPADYLAPANGLLGRSFENARRPADAATAYLAASKAADVDYLKASYLLDVARNQAAAGKKDEAIATYRQILDTYKKTNAVTEAEIRLAELTGGAM